MAQTVGPGVDAGQGDEERTGALVERLFLASLGMMDVAAVSSGTGWG
jgi:hypothetical protein